MSEGGEKTEMPTPKKLNDAREKGQVCSSKDVVSTALLIVLLALCAITGGLLVKDTQDFICFIGQTYSAPDGLAVNECTKYAVIIICKYSFLFSLVAAVVGVAAHVAQIGFLFTFEPMKPELNKLNPVEGAKKIFSLKNLFEFGKNVVKLSFLGILIYRIVVNSIGALLPICYGGIQDIMPVLKVILKNLAVNTAFGYIVVAVVDWFFQQKNFTKQMMMTKDEVKREYKEMEGSAEVKQAQNQFRQEILNGPDPAQAAKKSTTIVTNPTHLAVGLYYKQGETPLPKITVKGADAIAKVIKQAAMEANIPIMENVPLARALYKDGITEQYIPESLIEPVVEVLKWVQNMEAAKKEQEELDAIDLS